jgi:hypothetical protein
MGEESRTAQDLAQGEIPARLGDTVMERGALAIAGRAPGIRFCYPGAEAILKQGRAENSR